MKKKVVHMAYITILELRELPDGGVRRCHIGRLEALVSRRGDEVTAIKARCTHLPWRLPERQDSDGAVTCPFHGARFDLASGECVRGPVSKEWRRGLPPGVGLAAALVPGRTCASLESYPARILDGVVQVDAEVCERLARQGMAEAGAPPIEE